MLAWLAGKVLATPVIGAILGPVINGLLTAQKQKLDALDSHEARVQSVTIQAQQNDIREAELNNRLNIVEAGGNWFQRTPRPAMGWAATVLVWKILVWDLAFGQWTHGSTDMLSSQAFWLLETIVIAYFGGRTIDKGINAFASVFKKT